jgi:hypothetical protein
VIVSFEHRFAFVKVQKTAGTSIEVVLSQVAGADAIVTPINPPEPGHEARHWQHLPGSTPTKKGLRRRKSEPEPKGREAAFWNHMPASLVRERIGAEQWDSLYRFCFERNPWDKAISFYFWRTRRLDIRPSFEEWATTPGSLVSERSLYMIDGELAVDFVGRYEALDTDLQSVLDRVGVRAPGGLPRAKSQHRPNDARTPISEPADSVIRQEFAWEIEQFGYARPDAIPWE